MIQLVEGDYLRTKAGELPSMIKVYYLVNNMEKLVSVLGYMNETLSKKRYERIAHLVRLPV
jgi:hypothetical protein